MGAKRALIVDDSKSARLFLARVLEKYDIDVDAAESAEAAIDYLSQNRPDVIFMDHMMPGMDGLQAVQAIKNDPRTATIPIMMYTSQEGELYLGQARALGALGVLPKQIKPTDVSKVLFQLHLVPDRRSEEQSTFTPINLQLQAGEGAPLSKPLTDSALREHFAELRRALVASIDTQTDRITAEVRALLLESLPQPPPPAATPERVEPAAPAPLAASRLAPWLVLAALGIAALGTVAALRTAGALAGLREEVRALRSAQAAPAPFAAAPAPASPESPAAGEGTARPIVVLVPYGAEALGGSRLEVIRKLLYRVARDRSATQVDIRSYAGRFCLMGNPQDGYSLAPEEMPYARCDVVGNPFEENLSAAQRTPLSLANAIGDVRAATHGTLQVQISAGDAGSLAQPYPAIAAGLTAGEWNRAATANNRIEIRTR
ncbi:MAG: response regulator [Gammaproteobacteria bacterium]|nr:response regulator [Gammaproteobacteria bacterium]MBV9696368.1 response regulator [Gammaproteobacteria bacterium]